MPNLKTQYQICENKNPRIAKIAQTRKLGDREKKLVYSIYFKNSDFDNVYSNRR